MVFYVDQGAQKALRARTDFFLANVPTFDANAGVARPNIAVDTRLAEVARGICGAFPLPEPPREAPWEPLPEVSVAPPPLTSRRHDRRRRTASGSAVRPSRHVA